MDDNELENEREKREHEIALAEMQNPNPTNFWDVINESPILTTVIVLAILAMFTELFSKAGDHWYKGLF